MKRSANEVQCGSDYIGETCPLCGKGHLVGRRGRYGSFVGCSAFPRCKFNYGSADWSLQDAVIRCLLRRGVEGRFRQALAQGVPPGEAIVDAVAIFAGISVSELESDE